MRVTDRADIPVVAIVGHSDAGKTTVLEARVTELVARGVRVATVKHHPSAAETDTPQTDSWRHARAGAHVAMLATPHALATVERVAADPSLDEIAMRLGGRADVLLAEGYRKAAPARIEVVRTEVSPVPACAPHELAAIVAGEALALPGHESVTRFDPADTAGLADFIEQHFIDSGGASRDD
jgi:molybdopterin-guanine dinucleotide biosynthesis protein MobB